MEVLIGIVSRAGGNNSNCYKMIQKDTENRRESSLLEVMIYRMKDWMGA